MDDYFDGSIGKGEWNELNLIMWFCFIYDLWGCDVSIGNCR